MTDEQKRLLNRDLRTNGILKSEVSDLAGGITRKRIKGLYGHEAKYWEKYTPGTEAMASMYEAMMAKGERLRLMKEYYPNAYQMYVDKLFELPGGDAP
jgi:hypothetical protein